MGLPTACIYQEQHSASWLSLNTARAVRKPLKVSHQSLSYLRSTDTTLLPQAEDGESLWILKLFQKEYYFTHKILKTTSLTYLKRALYPLEISSELSILMYF